MGPISNGIDNVRSFELPAGIRRDGECACEPRAAFVRWRSAWADKLYQVYVNGRYAGTTVDSEQREMVVSVPTAVEACARIEVFAVDAEQGHIDFSEEVGLSCGQSGRVRLTLLRGQELPPGSVVYIYFDNGTGEIDYGEPIDDWPIGVWPVWQDKAGFGMSRFGASDVGYDSSAAVGFGEGSFGAGLFGLDADTMEWFSEPLEAGVYKFGVSVIDGDGNESGSSETGAITVTPAARPAGRVSGASFDKQTNQLILSVSN